MDDGTRQQRRRFAREQWKAGSKVLASGLAPLPRRDEIVSVARVVHAKLTEAGNDARASEAAELAQTTMERALRKSPPRVAIACRKGCNYCCSSYVMVVPPEAFRLAAWVKAGKAGALDPAEITRRAEPLKGVGVSDRIGAKLACPLLEQGTCSAYEVRPLVCRQATSLALQACVEEYQGVDRDGRVEICATHLAHSSNAHVVLLAAMRGARLPTTAYELSAVLVVALNEPDAERRWLAGEDVFKGVPRAPDRPYRVEQVAFQIGAELVV